MKAPTLTPAAFVEQLQALPSLPNVFNPWRDFDEANDICSDAPMQRANQLKCYLEPRLKTTRLVLVAEAPSWRGAKFTGIAMTSERMLHNEHPDVPASAMMLPIGERTSSEKRFPRCLAEQTATIVWSTLLDSGFRPDEFVLWNAFPSHPHKAGNPRSNRRPRLDELKVAVDVLPSLLTLLGQPKVVAVGKVAERALYRLGVSATSVRHPAMGGATKFREAMKQFVKDFRPQDIPKGTQRA
ncbi:MAG: uracil-DNA glycosylase [Hydrogenophaga sp.]|uniref:uracil-DNA glycosylase n=1 Tax=Hydrogenophaga sp. TaxID=1904254 RepID=UPI002ABA3082|nr:uracil-DNA glycosylase [Hydrogenophaga sp.]MDZ4176764.1 uracil-DNA glycosylase [Hydrogenophaga sp.]